VSLIVPAWLVVTMSGWRGLRSVWPAVLVCGGTFALVQFAWSNYVGVELVDIAGGLASIFALGLLLQGWPPRTRGSRAMWRRRCPRESAVRRPRRRSVALARGCRGCFSAWRSSSGGSRR
jgi:lactate permease